MSRVVAEIHDGGISLVGDTKITYEGDPGRTRQTFKYALPKLVILRHAFAAGYGGSQPQQLLRALIEARELAPTSILEMAAAIPNASFVFASLDPVPQLWQVVNGRIEDRLAIRRGWVGDQQAYDYFQCRYHEWPEGTSAAFRLMSSMQWLLSFQPVPSVGGCLTRVVTTDDGFRYVADPVTIGPDRMELTRVQAGPDSLTLELAVPDGGDTTSYSILPAVGRPPTPGALAYLVPQAGTALLFPADSPWQAVRLRVGSMADLLTQAAETHGQVLASAVPL